MPHAYSEDQLVEQPAIGLFSELGWQTVSALEETFGATSTLLRETKGEVFRATNPCGIRDGADCWQALNSRFCR